MLAEKNFTVAAIDVRGYGGSSKPYEIEAYSMRELSKDVIGVINALGFETAILIGHDWGGPIVWNTSALNETTVESTPPEQAIIATSSIVFFSDSMDS